MIRTIGLIELNSIARGIEVADVMIKAAEVNLLQASTICPGKYMVLISGDVGAVKASIEAGMEIGRECIVDQLVLPSIHLQLIPSINGTTTVEDLKALGIVEYFSIATAIVGADAAAKAASVELINLRLGIGIGGKAFIALTGDVSAVKESVEVATRIGEEKGMLVNKVVIPSPRKELFDELI